MDKFIVISPPRGCGKTFMSIDYVVELLENDFFVICNSLKKHEQSKTDEEIIEKIIKYR